jgi:hypothetical protein
MPTSPAHDAAAVRAVLLETHARFAPLRARFAGGGEERGGYERPGVIPIWTRKFGAYAQVLHEGVDRYVVEASFDHEQLADVQATLLLLKNTIDGTQHPTSLADRIVCCYVEETTPFWALALLRATEGLLRDVVALHPTQVCVLDAIMRVAGGEGVRDLIRFHGIRLLQQTIVQAEADLPDILAFVDVHHVQRRNEGGTSLRTKYEVWCPGYDLSKVFWVQCCRAALLLVDEYGITTTPSVEEEARQLPEVSRHLGAYVAHLTHSTLRQYGIDAS